MPDNTFVRIPQPTPSFLLGNLKDIESATPIQGFMRLAQTHGPIYKIDVLGRSVVLVSSQALVHELCDEQRFEKKLSSALVNARELAGDGLFTAYNAEPNWDKAHRLLMPAFGPLGIRAMYQPMLDIAGQLMLRWERFGPDAVVDVADNMTRLTLDTIALCAFDYRFNSFYQNEMHPFVDAMVNALSESGARTRRPPVANRLKLLTARKFDQDIRMLHRVADELVAERRQNPRSGAHKDLLDIMLSGRDPLTGEGLSDENIRYQLVTFLVAGHETTSGLLSFAIYLLLRHPDVLATARAEVDAVLGTETPRVEQIGRLRYVEQVLMETLRLWPTAPAFALKAKHDTVIGGRWPITKSDIVMVLIPMLHRDPAAWGDDVEAFRPERFAPDAYAKLPPDAWKPFGNGQRACIGRPFAMQKALLVLALVLQRFDLVDDDPAYQLSVAETLTLKPAGFRIRVKRRVDSGSARAAALPSAAPQLATPQQPAPRSQVGAFAANTAAQPVLVLYGSNTGSAEAFAQRIASDAAAHGFSARLAALDEYAGKLPTDGAVIVVSASYEGQPPDNARQFVAAVQRASPQQFDGVRFAIFGCGNRQWARTYQAVPRRIDAALAAAGATRLRPRGEADSGGDFFGDFDAWYATLWHQLADRLGVIEPEAPEPAAALRVEAVAEGRTSILRQSELRHGVVIENRELVDTTSPLGRSKRHVEIELPGGMTYRAGDYLAVLPRNPPLAVERTLRRFGFAADSRVVVHKAATSITSLPTGHPVSVAELLADYVELGQPATRAQVEQLAAATRCPPERDALRLLATEGTYASGVLDKRVSVLDLLEQHAACELGFAEFLAMLPPMRARPYSISSSPLWNDAHCTLTFAVVDAPALSGHGRYQGSASSMLAACAPGARVSVAVRPSHTPFHPPASPETPVVMVCAGTGIAPFRGFVQERAIQAAAGRRVGPALLFFGCDHPGVDDLYRDEFDAWQAAGAVSVRRAHSAAPVDGVEFVQHRLWADRTEVAELFRAGAHVYVCGDGRRMAPAVRETFVEIYRDAADVSLEAAMRWADKIERETGRYVADVFA
ncbi:cytochrome P450 [Variovorax sp. H27-G14]|uniref:bifunctional cytochrome P450/NADPH--P450 reductase n=1 Tax=Variovorax sp. H27-G14 TaxID=3111914 RepID=UPI0038FD1A7D